MERGGPSEEQRRDAAERDGEKDHARIEIEVGPLRNLIAGAGQQQAERPSPERQAREAAERRQDEVLDEQLPRQPEAARADRQADAHLPATCERPREHHAGDVRARDEQEQPHRHQQRRRRGAVIAHELLVQRLRVRRDDVLFVARVPDRLLRAQEILLGVGNRDAWLQPAHGVEAVALPRLIGIAGEWHPQTHAAGELRLTRHHADDGADHAVQFERAPEHIGASAESLTPERVADDDDRRPLRAILVRREHPAEDGLDPEHRRKVVRHRRALDPVGAPLVGHVEAERVVQRQALERVRGLAPLMEVGVVDPDDVEVPARGGFVDVNQAVRLRERKRPQEQRAHQAEHDDVGRHADREHGDDERGGQLLPGEPSKGVLEIGAEHDALPFDWKGGDRAAAAEHRADAGADDVPRGREPRAGGSAANRFRVGEGFEKQRFHLVAVALPQTRRREQEQKPIQTLGARRGHSVSPWRGLTRDRAMRTSPASRCVSADTTARPARVIR